MRPATPNDLPDLLRMGHAFAKAAGVDADDDSLTTTLNLLMDSGGLFVTGEPVHGMAAGLLFPQYFKRSQMVAQELFWWVDPEARRSGAGRDLLTGMEAWARAGGAESLTMVALSNLDGIEKFYESHGYTPQERHYVKVL